MNMKQEYFLFICFKWKKLGHIFMLSRQRIKLLRGFPGGSEGKASACNVGDPGSIPGSARSPGEGNGHPLQYSCLETPRTEEPGRLQSMGSQRAGRDWVTEQLQPTSGWLAPRVTPCHILRVIKLPSTALVITYPGPEVIRQICKP